MNYFILTLIYFSLYNVYKSAQGAGGRRAGKRKKEAAMVDQRLEIADDKGLFRLKWEYEKEQKPWDDLLCFGTADMDYRSPQPILDALERVIQRGHLGYPMIPDAYYEAIQNWLLRTNAWEIDARSSVLQNAGIYMAAWTALNILTAPGDAVAILTPVHFCFREILTLNRRRVMECPLILEGDGYRIDFGALEACLAAGSKVLWICNPHNPVGRAWKKEELQKIADLCLRYQAWILSDDVYCGLIFPEGRYTAIASLSREISYRTITLYSTSKTYNTAALRHAFIVAENPEICKQYREALNAMSMEYGQNLMGIVATIAAFNECDAWLDRLRKKIAENHRFLTQYFESQIPGRCRVMKSDASYFAWIDLRKLRIRPQTLSYQIEQEAHMIVENGYPLGRGGAGFIRMNLATSRANIEEGAKRLKKFCERRDSRI